jgi:hypothetical protein
MSLPGTSIPNALWLIPVVVACSPPVDIAKQAGVGGSASGGSNAAAVGAGVGGSASGGSNAAAVGGSSAAASGGANTAALGGSSSSSAGGSSTPAMGGSNAAAGGGIATAPTGGMSTRVTSAAGGTSATGTGGTPSTGGMNTGAHAGTTNPLICTGLSEVECNARQEQCTSTYGYTKPNLGGTRTYVGCHTGFGCPAATTCGYPAGQPDGCLLFASGCLPDGWVQDSNCSAPACPNSRTGTGGTTSMGGAPSTGGTTSTGGGSSADVRSRVIVMDSNSNRFSAYDAEGQLVHDYQSLLDFGAGYGDRVICIDNWDYSWDGTASSPFFAPTVLAPPGQEPPLAPTELIVTAKAEYATKAMASVRVANISGEVTDELSILGDWQGFISSPSRQYLQGGISGITGIILRRSDHGTVWQGPLYQAGFSPDDQHLIGIPTSNVDAVFMVELTTGRATNFDLTKLPAGFASPNNLYIRGTFNSGAVLTGNRANGAGYAVYWATWDGAISPIDPTLPVGVDEWPGTASRDSARLTLSRRAQYGVTVDASLLGWFEVDVGTTNVRALPHLNDTSGDCYDTAVTKYYALSDTLSSCSCTSSACAPFASWPLPSDAKWEPELIVSPQRGFVGVEYQWVSQTIPTTSAASRLYNAQGDLLFSFDSGPYGGSFAFDRLEQMVLIDTYASTSSDAVYNPASGHTNSLGTPRWLAFGYE